MTLATFPRCFVGWSGPREPPAVPAGGALVWGAPRPLWTVGDWQPQEVRFIQQAGARAAFLGSCQAADQELHEALRSALATSRVEPLRRLSGSFAVVVDDGHQAHVLTDRAGLHPVFHTRLADGTVFASDALILAGLHHRNLGEAINPLVLSAGLFLPCLPDLGAPDSVFTRVQRAGPDQALTIPSGRPAQTRPLPATAGRSSVEEAAEALRTALVEAIRSRVRPSNRLSVDLSGGLDSSALAVLAAEDGSRPLAITYADPYAVNEEDVELAGHVAAEARLDHVITTGSEATLPFTAMAGAPLTDEPSLDVLIFARSRFRLEPALEHCSELHLTGDGGDVVLAATGLAYLGDLARARHRRALRHEADGWARLRHHQGRALRRGARRLASTSWPDTVQHLAGQLMDADLSMPPRRSLQDRLAWATLSPAATWGTPRTRRTLAAHLLARPTSGAAGDPRPDSADAAALRALHWHGAATRTYTQITRSLGLLVHTPYFDHPVIDACLAAPAITRTTVDQAKPLLGAATGDLLPPRLLARRTKGDYTPCEYHGLRANASSLRELMTNPHLADLHILNPDGPGAALHLGLTGAHAPLGALGAVIATETWLRALDTLDPTSWWTPPSRPLEQNP